jgi:hypothetical protein
MPAGIPSDVKINRMFAFTITSEKTPNPAGPVSLEISMVLINWNTRKSIL